MKRIIKWLKNPCKFGHTTKYVQVSERLYKPYSCQVCHKDIRTKEQLGRVTMKEELKKLTKEAGFYYYDPDEVGEDAFKPLGDDEVEEFCTSIINLVDKEIPGKENIDDIDDIQNWRHYDGYSVNANDFANGYNQAIDDMRAKLKGVSNE